MNPRLTDIPLHADQPRESGLDIDYFHPPPWPLRWLYFILGFGMGAAFMVVLYFAGGR